MELQTENNNSTTYEKCQSIYWNLIELLEAKHFDLTATNIINELEQTSRCDSISKNLSEHRADIKQMVGEDTLERVFNLNENEIDERKCTQALIHYHTYTRKAIAEGLSPMNKLYYYTIHKPERMAGTITGITSFAGLGVWAIKQQKVLKKKYR
jgi:phosphoribosyl-ATP pyrophosphohydrolase